jgi:hypothetical protein
VGPDAAAGDGGEGWDGEGEGEDGGAWAGEEGGEGAEEGGEDADPLAGLPPATVVVEQALVQGGRERRRLVATLKLRQPPGGEVDVEVGALEGRSHGELSHSLLLAVWLGALRPPGAPWCAPVLQQPSSAPPRHPELSTPPQVARMVLFVEHWAGAPPEAGRPEAPLRAPPACAGFGVPAPSLPRAAPGQLAGVWNVFGVAAAPVEERDPETGELR